jgi:hypothetical protein
MGAAIHAMLTILGGTKYSQKRSRFRSARESNANPNFESPVTATARAYKLEQAMSLSFTVVSAGSIAAIDEAS